jgi:adenine/guanine phosphoribosyltransferase-like PRPP-binding protein
MSAICTAEASKYVHAAYAAQKSTFEMIPVRKEVEGGEQSHWFCFDCERYVQKS